MTDKGVFLTLLGVYLAGLVGVGLVCARRQKSVADFWLAGRRVGAVAIGFSAAASWLTAGALLAVVGFFMLSGMGSIWGFVAPNVLALLGIALLVGKIKSLPAVTQPELLEQRYGPGLRAPVALVITVVMILFAVADIKGFALVLEITYGLSPAAAAAIVALAVSLYVTLGGFAAVVWTDLLQFLFLAAFALGMAGAVTAAAGAAAPAGAVAGLAGLAAGAPAGWWNPLSIGLPLVLIFCLAILPGWVSEQDPWQRVWAARDARAARRGMVLGAGLILLVFAACAVIALGLARLHPEIAALGFPAGMPQAEPALLRFILGQGYPPAVVALLAIGLAAAAMSCADTFATSGASCLSRDIYQRYLRPDAAMGEVLAVNRLCVLVIVLAATAASFAIRSIIDAIHIATFIASAAYFFPLMGGIFWKRATREGALAALAAGGLTQTALVALDLAATAPLAPPYLETLHPALMGHGVIAGMAVSGLAFVAVSLATRPSEAFRLAPFFPAAAAGLGRPEAVHEPEDAPLFQRFRQSLREEVVGDRTQMHLTARTSEPLDWKALAQALLGRHPAWVAPTGRDTLYRMTESDLLACVAITRGKDRREIWFRAEPRNGGAAARRRELLAAFGEVARALGREPEML
jgi:SSS family solute:Na+ symporter